MWLGKFLSANWCWSNAITTFKVFGIKRWGTISQGTSAPYNSRVAVPRPSRCCSGGWHNEWIRKQTHRLNSSLCLMSLEGHHIVCCYMDFLGLCSRQGQPIWFRWSWKVSGQVRHHALCQIRSRKCIFIAGMYQTNSPIVGSWANPAPATNTITVEIEPQWLFGL